MSDTEQREKVAGWHERGLAVLGGAWLGLARRGEPIIVTVSGLMMSLIYYISLHNWKITPYS